MSPELSAALNDYAHRNDPHVVTEKRNLASGFTGWLSEKWTDYQEKAERLKKRIGSAASGAWRGLFGTRERNESKEQAIAALEGDPIAQRIAARDVGKEFENVTADVAREGAEQSFEAGKTYVETELGIKGVGMAAGTLKMGGKALGRELGALKAEERALAAEERSLEYNIAPHGRQPSPRSGYASHHGVQQQYLKENVPGYDPNKDPTILLRDAPGGAHKQVTGEQAARRAQVRRDLGSKYGADYGAERAAAIEQMRRTGVPEEKIGQWVLEHDAYLFELGKKH
jgi:HNH/Endo VII superfamily toxin with a SHH signature